MNKRNPTTFIIVLAICLAIAIPLVTAGSKNQNDGNGKSNERGTGKINGREGCEAWGGHKAVDLGPPLGAVWGGACCPSNEQLGTTAGGNNVHAPNQCCNPPDYVPGTPIPTGLQQPGNHCECFAIRGYTPVP
jgi:hypothetical protein